MPLLERYGRTSTSRGTRLDCFSILILVLWPLARRVVWPQLGCLGIIFIVLFLSAGILNLVERSNERTPSVNGFRPLSEFSKFGQFRQFVRTSWPSENFETWSGGIRAIGTSRARKAPLDLRPWQSAYNFWKRVGFASLLKLHLFIDSPARMLYCRPVLCARKRFI